MKTNRTVLVGLALTLPAALLLTGCSVVEEAVSNQASSEYPDASALRSQWDGDAAWVPSDSTSLQVAQSKSTTDATILLTSDLDLDPDLCAEIPRQSAPTVSMDDAPDAYAMDTVFACGSWTVGATSSGWLGWTPGHPDESAQSPS
ncbi:hypothetical protein [Marisediminicola senii]|uniref:hypothetical protein n=1 Tax=Marisediminicola senii TaxID=2711233 RepID=UPI0013EB6B13|nr:hypothetical protein [Marisediminicola senii]